MIHDVIVIGGGPAGLSAALNCRLEGLGTLVIESGIIGGRAAQSARIDNVLGHELTGREFAHKAHQHALQHGVKFLSAMRVQQITPGVCATAIGPIFGKAIVIASGLQWRELDVPGMTSALERGSARYGCDIAVDADRVRGRWVGIVGGANSAGINALHFARECGARGVNLFIRSGLEGMSHYLKEAILAQPNIYPLLGHEPLGVHQHVSGEGLEVETPRGFFGVDELFLFPDALPRTNFVQCDKDERGFLKCDSTGMTSLPGVFACGDVRAGTIKRIATAIGDGAAVAFGVKNYLKELSTCAQCVA